MAAFHRRAFHLQSTGLGWTSEPPAGRLEDVLRRGIWIEELKPNWRVADCPPCRATGLVLDMGRFNEEGSRRDLEQFLDRNDQTSCTADARGWRVAPVARCSLIPCPRRAAHLRCARNLGTHRLRPRGTAAARRAPPLLPAIADQIANMLITDTPWWRLGCAGTGSRTSLASHRSIAARTGRCPAAASHFTARRRPCLGAGPACRSFLIGDTSARLPSNADWRVSALFAEPISSVGRFLSLLDFHGESR